MRSVGHNLTWTACILLPDAGSSLLLHILDQISNQARRFLHLNLHHVLEVAGVQVQVVMKLRLNCRVVAFSRLRLLLLNLLFRRYILRNAMSSGGVYI